MTRFELDCPGDAVQTDIVFATIPAVVCGHRVDVAAESEGTGCEEHVAVCRRCKGIVRTLFLHTASKLTCRHQCVPPRCPVRDVRPYVQVQSSLTSNVDVELEKGCSPSFSTRAHQTSSVANYPSSDSSSLYSSGSFQLTAQGLIAPRCDTMLPHQI